VATFLGTVEKKFLNRNKSPCFCDKNG